MTARSMSGGGSLGRFTLRAMPRRMRWSATVRRWTPNSRARSANERPCWYSAATAATSECVSRRWTGFVGHRAAPPAVGESTPSTSARCAMEPGFECCPLLSRPPAPGRFKDRCGVFLGFRPAAFRARNPCSGAVSRVSGGFESRPQRSTGVVEITTLSLVSGGFEKEPGGVFTSEECDQELCKDTGHYKDTGHKLVGRCVQIRRGLRRAPCAALEDHDELG